MAAAPTLNIKSTDLFTLSQEDEHKDLITNFVIEKYETLKQKPSELATEVKKYLDEKLGSPWHIIIGKSFASSISHEKNGFIYFYVDNLAVLCFKTI
ncbi:hypothetical protein CANINC_000825 [Pichia inconspicua]|uniref:Dynein light chain n=1 Tax=Pichia inconspicua TaxID=52247 RepID=A0A4V4NG48_9ASCO|nr:hypothetical protein CANINC_000825 [[Candida] inconspicua]